MLYLLEFPRLPLLRRFNAPANFDLKCDMSAPFGVAVFVPLFSSGIASGTAELMAGGAEEAAATIQACVSSLHTTALVQVISVIIGIVICFMLPKIYEDRK